VGERVSGRLMCARHPSEPLDDCGFCDRLIDEVEHRELWMPDEDDAAAEARYERWVEGWRP
jgi:hypothetical protein